MATRPRPRILPVEPALRLVEGGRSRRRAMVPAAVVLLMAVFAVAALQAYLGQDGYRVSRLEREVEQAEERMVILRGRAAELSSPSRLEESAAGMGMTEDPNPVFLPDPGVAPPPAAGASSSFRVKRLLSGGG
ncbi:MAG TPA: hypothetical protein VNE62_08870 [Actinomycetota bacterium]|nr:hypothetical protein [Actinomycetota bacterium]